MNRNYGVFMDGGLSKPEYRVHLGATSGIWWTTTNRADAVRECFAQQRAGHDAFLTRDDGVRVNVFSDVDG